jgi:hypothetical protein
MFNIYLGIYIIAAIVIIAGGTFKLFKLQQLIAAVIFFIGSLTIFIIYGIRWFEQANSLFSKTPVSWPPTINTCPDYLIYYDRIMPDGGSQKTCIDTIGVSKNGALKPFPAYNKSTGSAPSGEEYYFSLITTNSEPAKRNAELCQRAIAFGLTWEGITNGESCSSSADSSGGNANNGGCPAF